MHLKRRDGGGMKEEEESWYRTCRFARWDLDCARTVKQAANHGE